MSATWLYRLKPRSPFHFGERGVGIEATEEVCHSDTLFSALCCALREAEGEEALEEFLAPFRGPAGPPFLISSLFPYAGPVLFFLKPLVRPSLPKDSELAREYKKIRFVSQGIFQALLRGDDLSGEENLFHGGTVWATAQERPQLPWGEGAEEEPRFWKRQAVPRVTVDRASAASEIYHAGLLFFGQDCGLYFLLRASEEGARRRVEGLLRYLGDAGLGGERSAGHGQFGVESAAPFSLEVPPEAEAFVTLALYHPTLEELKGGVLDGPAAYELVMRRGWIYSPERGGQRRKGVRMLAEGSVLRGPPFPDGKGPPDRAYGDLADVTPEMDQGKHPVYRYGFAFPVAVRPKEAEDG